GEGDEILHKEVPITAGASRFREAWKRDFRNSPSSLDGDLTRVIAHAVAIRGVERGSGAVLRAVTDPSERVTNSRGDIAPWIGRLRTKVTDVNNEADVAIPNRVTGGTSALVFSGPEDAPQWWTIIDPTITMVNNNTVHADTLFHTPFDQFARGESGITGGDVLIKVLP